MSRPLVHQSLHGYSDGHRLIAGSSTLSSVDARMMQVMSDLSGPGVKPAATGYLTGYPLEGSGKYVFARTWAAPEMPRPGCVWTHSLIIENADLATFTSADCLLAALRRPDGPTPRDGYTAPIEIRPVPERAPATTAAIMARSAEVLNAVYAAPDKAVVVQAGDHDEDEQLVTAIWMQQWPRLRRSFAFCTLTKVDRSLNGEGLDLQMVPGGERQLRSKFKDAVNPADVAFDPVSRSLSADLFSPGPSQLREFLRRTGGDVEGGRRAMIPLVQLYNAVFTGTPELSAAVAAFGLLDSLGRRQARSLRLVVARQALQHVDDVDDDVFEFLVDALEKDFAASDETDLSERFGTALWRRSPSRFVEALSEAGPIGRAVDGAVERLTVDDLIKLLGGNARAAERLALRRPDLMESPQFWMIDGVDESLTKTVEDAVAADVASAMISAGRSSCADDLIFKADPARLAAVLEVERSDHLAAEAWTRALAQNPTKAAAVLGSGHLRRAATLVSLARAMAPDDVPNDSGEDPWWIAVRSAHGKLSSTDEDYLSAFLMARALGRRSRSTANLVCRAYTTVHEAMSRRSPPFPDEWMVVARLEWGSWLAWDRVSRLRTTVVNRFVNDQLDPEAFGRLSPHGAIVKDLIDEAAHTARGRRYLIDVRKALKEATTKGLRSRADYIAKKLA